MSIWNTSRGQDGHRNKAQAGELQPARCTADFHSASGPGLTSAAAACCQCQAVYIKLSCSICVHLEDY